LQSSALKHLKDPRQRFWINVRVHSDASPVTKIDLDQSNTRGHYRPPSAITRR
jgi:hypothetical protein